MAPLIMIRKIIRTVGTVVVVYIGYALAFAGGWVLYDVLKSTFN